MKIIAASIVVLAGAVCFSAQANLGDPVSDAGVYLMVAGSSIFIVEYIRTWISPPPPPPPPPSSGL